MSDRTVNYQIALAQIRAIVGLPVSASPSAIVAKVRELQFAAAIPGASLPDQQAQLRGSIRIPL